MKIIAIIPARGGSKGVPGKNIRKLAGKPLIAHTIEQARNSDSINRLIVSTDDYRIASAAQEYGAEVIMRPADISGDNASSESALLHTVEHLKKTEGYTPDLLVLLQCTSPLMTADDIDGSVQILIEENADTALTVTSFHYFLWQKDKKGNLTGINHNKNKRLLRQQREQQFMETGAVYVMRTQGFKEAKHRFFGKTAMYITPPERCLEIDEPVDFKMAETLIAIQKEKLRQKSLPEHVAALIMDFDGVFTDNRVIVFEDGMEAVICNRSDGLGLSSLKRTGLPVLVLSTEKNPVVQARCKKLGIKFIQGLNDKLSVLKDWLKSNSLELKDVIYIGNDVNDLSCLQKAGCGVAVNDAHPQVKAIADIILSSPGGYGAIRELIDLIKQYWEDKKDAKGC